jgi:hypothetical protein
MPPGYDGRYQAAPLHKFSLPPPPDSVRLYGTFRSLRAMVAIFKVGLRVLQKRTAMPSYSSTASETIAKA